MLAIARRFALAVTFSALAACTDGPVEPPFNQWLARARWDRANIDSYEMTVRRLCFCGFVDPVRVTVSDGAIVSRVNLLTGEPVPENIAELFPDVPGLFAIVDDARANADELDAEYDETYGFPRSIVIDWIENAADDEVAYVVEDFGVRLE